MSLFKTFKTLDNKFSWSFMGFVIGLLGIGYAIYIDQFKEDKPMVVFDVLSNTQVLSVKENLNKLDIIYDGQNLKERNENLILLTLRISNEGNEDIRENDYYSKAPFGFKLEGCNIAEPPVLIDASNDFIKGNIEFTYDSLNRVVFNKIPFNKEQYYTLKVLTICGSKDLPAIKPFGNISGINEPFPVRQSFKESQKEELSFVEKITLGNFGIHVARFFFYIFSMVIFGLLVGIPASKISTAIEEKKRKRLIKKFRDKSKVELTDNIELIFEIFLEDGSQGLKWLNRIINDNKRLKKYLQVFKNRESENTLFEDYMTERPIDERVHFERISHRSRNSVMFNQLKEKGIIEVNNEDVKVDQTFKDELREFVYFIDVQE